MSKMTATIPFTKIKKVEIYVNSKKKSMSQIQAELKCDYLINAGLYSMSTFKAMNKLIVNNKIIANSPDKLGMSFSGNKIALSYDNNVNYPYHVSGYPCLLKDGKKSFTKTPSGLGGSRGRSAIGYGTYGIVLYCCSDGSDALYLDGLCNKMKELGCIHAINLDGGGSSQGYFAGKKITSTRIVHNYIAIWLEPEKSVSSSSNTQTTSSKPVTQSPSTTSTSLKTKTVNVKASSSLRIRKNPPNIFGINKSTIIGFYYRNQKITILETKYGWSRTDRGWVSNLYLK